MDTIRVDDTTTRADLAETLAHLCAHAKRQMYLVERYEKDPPTAWTKAHRQINAVLDDYEVAPDGG
jgi:ABC-type transporter lipoprotein component MlaA